MLATLAVLKGVGVGDSTATPLAATLTWMFRGAFQHLNFVSNLIIFSYIIIKMQ